VQMKHWRQADIYRRINCGYRGQIHSLASALPCAKFNESDSVLSGGEQPSGHATHWAAPLTGRRSINYAYNSSSASHTTFPAQLSHIPAHRKAPCKLKSQDTLILNWARSPSTALFDMIRLVICSSIISLPIATTRPKITLVLGS
jgi:hypothetical protein